MSVLRFFTRANFHPKLVSSCAPLGSLTENRRKYFQLRGGKLITFHRSKSINDRVLTDADLAECREKGLDILSGLLLKEKLTSFQNEVLQAVFIYSKDSTAYDVAEKLIYVLVAIESMFVRDKKENFHANIGERMAFFAGETAEERPKIKNNVVRIYDIRSSFLHHGEPVGIDKLEA